MENKIEVEKKVRNDVYNFFAAECNVDQAALTDDTKIIEDLGGDSLMLLQLMERWKSEYKIDLEFRTIGRFMIKNPVINLGSAIDLAVQIICEKDKVEEACKS